MWDASLLVTVTSRLCLDIAFGKIENGLERCFVKHRLNCLLITDPAYKFMYCIHCHTTRPDFPVRLAPSFSPVEFSVRPTIQIVHGGCWVSNSLVSRKFNAQFIITWAQEVTFSPDHCQMVVFVVCSLRGVLPGAMTFLLFLLPPYTSLELLQF